MKNRFFVFPFSKVKAFPPNNGYNQPFFRLSDLPLFPQIPYAAGFAWFWSFIYVGLKKNRHLPQLADAVSL